MDPHQHLTLVLLGHPHPGRSNRERPTQASVPPMQLPPSPLTPRCPPVPAPPQSSLSLRESFPLSRAIGSLCHYHYRCCGWVKTSQYRYRDLVRTSQYRYRGLVKTGQCCYRLCSTVVSLPNWTPVRKCWSLLEFGLQYGQSPDFVRIRCIRE